MKNYFLGSVFFLFAAIFLIVAITSCSKPQSDLESLTKDVLKSKQGVDIKVEPIKEDK